MPVPRFVRDNAFQLARRDLALFLEEHEEDLLSIFREEMQQLDHDLPEEDVYIDLDMVGIGDMLLKAVLRTLHRFLVETPSASPPLRRKRRGHNPETSSSSHGSVMHIPVKSRH